MFIVVNTIINILQQEIVVYYENLSYDNRTVWNIFNYQCKVEMKLEYASETLIGINCR